MAMKKRLPDSHWNLSKGSELRKFAILLIVALAASVGLAAMPAFPSQKSETPGGSVAIVSGSTINVVSRESSLPIVVSNTLPGEVRVILRVSSNSPKLIILQESIQLTIRSGTIANPKIPIQELGSGDVEITTWLTSLNGLQLGDKVPLHLTVNPAVEAIDLVLFFGFVAALIILGAIRTARQKRSDRQMRQGGS
jgi:hypothetical protein